MANQNFTDFTLKTPTSGDFLVGYNADGSDEFRTTVEALLSSYATNAISITFTQLTALSSSNALIPGRYYNLSDFVTEYIGNSDFEWISPNNPLNISNNPNGTPIPISAIAAKPEPLILQAIAPNKFSHIAYSLQYPRDIIHYDPNFTYLDGINTAKGFITYREDPLNQISCPYDWRNIRFKRYFLDPNSFPQLLENTQYFPGDYVHYNGSIALCLSAQTTPSNLAQFSLYPTWHVQFNISTPSLWPNMSRINWSGTGSTPIGEPSTANYYSTFSSHLGNLNINNVSNVKINPAYPSLFTRDQNNYSFRLNNITIIRPSIVANNQIANVLFEEQNSSMSFYITDSPIMQRVYFGIGNNSLHVTGGALYYSSLTENRNCFIKSGAGNFFRNAELRNINYSSLDGSSTDCILKNLSECVINQSTYHTVMEYCRGIAIAGNTATWDISDVSQNGLLFISPTTFYSKTKITQGVSQIPVYEYYDDNDDLVRISYYPNLVYKHADNQITSRLKAISNTNFKPIFETKNHETGTYVRNLSCWCYDLAQQMTCISPWNSSNASLSGERGGGVLITPRHIYMAAHYSLSANAVVRFVTQNNQVIDRTILRTYRHPSYNPATGWPNVSIGLLDSDVPSTISPCKVLPREFTDYFPRATIDSIEAWDPIPAPAVLYTDLEEKALVSDLAEVKNYNGTVTSGQYRYTQPTSTIKLSAYEPLTFNDSGNPSFFIINNNLVLLSVLSASNSNFYGTCYSLFEQGSNGFYNVQTLQQMISVIDAQQGIATNYQVSSISLNEFSRISYSVLPTPSVTPTPSAVYVSYSIPLKVSVPNGNYTIDQFGSNNPSLTCYKGTNYDFIINTNSHPFALRASINDTTTTILSTFNNDPLNGKRNGSVIYFTPGNDTPNTVYYQSTTQPSMSGVIYIKDYSL